jgi:hypothetical protein
MILSLSPLGCASHEIAESGQLFAVTAGIDGAEQNHSLRAPRVAASYSGFGYLQELCQAQNDRIAGNAAAP